MDYSNYIGQPLSNLLSALSRDIQDARVFHEPPGLIRGIILRWLTVDNRVIDLLITVRRDPKLFALNTPVPYEQLRQAIVTQVEEDPNR